MARKTWKKKLTKKDKDAWLDKTKERTERLTEMVDGALDRFLVATDEARRSDELKRWLGAMACFHRYSFRNTILIMMQLEAMSLPIRTKVAGYTTWKKVDRHVKKGERATIEILRPNLKSRKATADEVANGSAVYDSKRGEHVRKFLSFRPAYVFHAGQTEGEEFALDHFAHGDDDHGLWAHLAKVASANGIKVEVEDTEVKWGAKGVSTGGMVSIDQALEPVGRAATLAHELAHEMLHWNGSDKLDNTERKVREAEAECVAYVVCAAYGIDHPGAATYVAAWTRDERPEQATKLLMASMGRIRDAASKLLGGNGPDGDAD